MAYKGFCIKNNINEDYEPFTRERYEELKRRFPD